MLLSADSSYVITFPVLNISFFPPGLIEILNDANQEAFPNFGEIVIEAKKTDVCCVNTERQKSFFLLKKLQG